MGRKKITEHTGVKGSFRLQILEPDGRIVGDSGWHTNQITNEGFNKYLCQLIDDMAGSLQVSHMAIGSGGAPNATDTTLSGEQDARAAVTAASSATSKTVRFTATFNSSDNFVSDTINLANLGLFNSEYGGSIFAGNTFNSSSCATNQNVNATYDITFS
jgi:hypothetical protein